jgi:beta-lactamase superfamily II metal-dependent hydrolase
MRRILALSLSVVLIIMSFTGCSLLTSDDPVTDIQNQLQNGIDNFKDKMQQEAENIVNDAANGALDKIDEMFNPGGSSASIENQKLSITMLDVGQGLSLLIESNGEYMLYDGGDRETSSYVVSYLQRHNVKTLKYVVASHYDSDHISGLVGVLKNFTVKNVINPDYTANTKTYKSYVEQRDNSGATVFYPSVGDTYNLGLAKITVLAPAKDYGDSNEMSVAMRIDCESFSCIVTGDAESESEADMLRSNINLDTDLYVVGHHGSSSSSTDKFVKAMSPKYAFISVGEDNDYGHPADRVLNVLEKSDARIYRTDLHGEVVCVTDGKLCAFSNEDTQENNTNSTDDTETSAEYVLNTSSMKFHLTSCSSVEKIGKNNKEYSSEHRDTLIDNGYTPCGYCDP